ncbi:hypothetical protein JCM10207_000588 [Rhodosporidiobolus poonsookiae]
MAAPNANADELAAFQALSEREKAAKGFAWHGDGDDELTEDRMRAKGLFQAYNQYPWPKYFPGFTFADQFGPEPRQQLLADLFRIPLEKAKALAIEPPFFCDYGYNIEFGNVFYCNVNCCFLDGAKIKFGDRCVLGPAVQIYTTTHSVEPAERRAWRDRSYPVVFGSDIWVGGGAVILPGTVIGNGCTIAAGAVVKGTFPPNSVIGGVPARVLKTLDAAPAIDAPGGIMANEDPRLWKLLPGMEGRTMEDLGEMEKAARGE